jgi:sec-independent protein translocase protein TatA
VLGKLGLREILIIVTVITVLFGARRIPELAGSFGKTIRNFKREVRDTDG